MPDNEIERDCLIKQLLNKLNNTELAIIWMFYFEGYTMLEIGKRIGLKIKKIIRNNKVYEQCNSGEVIKYLALRKLRAILI